VYAQRLDADTFDTRIRALRAWDPNAVLVTAATARVSWPTISVPIVTCALKHHRQPQRGFHFSRRQVPAELVMSRAGLRYTSPALTALDLCESHGGDAVDEALRARATTLKDLHQALQLTSAPLRNAERRRLLLDSKDEPYSAAERRFHLLLRAAGITAWKANQSVLLDGRLYHSASADPHPEQAILYRAERPRLTQRESHRHARGERQPRDNGGLYRVVEVGLAWPDRVDDVVAGVELVMP
jgi:hypothetical protein